MMRSLWRKTWRKLAAVAVAGVLAGTTVDQVYSQDTSPEALLQRLERLEQQNRELQQKLQNVQSPVAAADGSVDTKTVENIVSNYLQAQAKKEKAKKAEKKNEFVEVGSDMSMKATWKDGVYFESPNKDFKFHVGGRVQVDTGWFDETPTTNMPRFDDATGFRRARLRADGTMWEIFNFATEVDFANPSGTADRATFTDVYAEVTQLPWVGNIRAGRFKEPFSLEGLVSSRYINHIERSTAAQAFVPLFNLGIMGYRTFGDQQRLAVFTGLFRDDACEGVDPSRGNGGFGKGDGEYCWTSRVTFLPVWEHEGRCLVHVGAAYSWRNFFGTGPADVNNRPRYQANSEVRLGTPLLLDTGAINDIASTNLWGGEFAAQRGPLSVMSDVYVANVDREDIAGNSLPSPTWWGGYVQVGYFLTGEHRPYNRNTGAFDRVRPFGNFFRVKDEHGGISRGTGAWEVIARASYLDLSDEEYVVLPDPVTKAGGTGILRSYTFGVNWYLNPNMKWMVNYVHTDRGSNGGPAFNGDVDVLVARFAMDF